MEIKKEIYCKLCPRKALPGRRVCREHRNLPRRKYKLGTIFICKYCKNPWSLKRVRKGRVTKYCNSRCRVKAIKEYRKTYNKEYNKHTIAVTDHSTVTPQ
jgi:hypothetical protein